MKKTIHTIISTCTLLLCLILLAGCIGRSRTASQTDPWPLADGAEPLETILPDESLRSSALRVFGSAKPWKLSGIDPEDGTRLINTSSLKGLPNELERTSLTSAFLGYRPWADAYKSIAKGRDFCVTYELSDNVPEGYTRVKAFVGGIDYEGYPTAYEFQVILRNDDAVPVQAAMTSITSN